MMTSSSSSPVASRPPRQLPRSGASKAQAALARIIAVISAAPNTSPSPPPPAPVVQLHVIAREKKPGGFRAVDLGLRLGPPRTPAQEIVGAYGSLQEESRCGVSAGSGDVGAAEGSSVILPPAATPGGAGVYVSPAASVAGGDAAAAAAKSSEGECDPEEETEGESKADGDVKGVTVVADERKGSKARCGGCGGGAEASMADAKRGHGGHLDLLLEAVRKVSGGLFDDDADADDELREGKAEAASLTAAGGTPAAGGRTTRRSGTAKRGKEAAEWGSFDLYEETAPIVRSKRGRSQALPSRYRDSVMEPWRKPPAVARHGRSTTKP